MFDLLHKVIGTPSQRRIRGFEPTLDHINDLEGRWEKLSDDELRSKTAEFKTHLDNVPKTGIAKEDRKIEEEVLFNLLPEAFATVREASKRTLGMRHYDVQMIGGMILHEGGIAEMRTGEGKTLVATLPSYLNALAGKGVHVVTVNDYLAKRDAEWMGQVHEFLGLSVGKVLSTQRGADLFTNKKIAYAADITYGTNNEFGFDYLRDHMAKSLDQLVQRPYYYAIIDEVDSILIDEARTPLIISGRLEQSAELYYKMAEVVPQLEKETDYTVDEKAKNVIITEEGIDHAQEILDVEDLFDIKTNYAHFLLQALKAKELYIRDVDYVVTPKGEVAIVDEFTGRLMEGRRWSDGLHQSVEAKEGVQIQDETQTLASITYQNLFRLYPKLSGMTGTALTEEAEFGKIYNLEVTEIPTNRDDVRQDLPDCIYKTEGAKYRAVVKEIETMHQMGRPVLVGTVSIEKSEMISKMLSKMKIPHNVLNAKQHEKEAHIVAQAGRRGAVTIATNMAGRGTDILLGGNAEFLALEELAGKGVSPQDVTPTYIQELTERLKEKVTDVEKADVVSAGGLHVIGTERHESRRIDNQLRGRAARQGDPGSTQFFLSLEDNLMRIFQGERVAKLMEMLNIDEDIPINMKMVSGAIESAQRKVEAYHFDIRKQILKYDDVLTEQRKLIYDQRQRVLEGKGLRDSVMHMIQQETASIVRAHISADMDPGQYPDDAVDNLLATIHSILPQRAEQITREAITGRKYQELIDWLQEQGILAYKQIEEDINEVRAQIKAEHGIEMSGIEGAEHEDDKHPLRLAERDILLHVVDAKWIDYLHNLDSLREGIGLRAYGQKDPLIEYKREAFELFQELTYDIQHEVVMLLFRTKLHIQIEPPPEDFQPEQLADSSESEPDNPVA